MKILKVLFLILISLISCKENEGKKNRDKETKIYLKKDTLKKTTKAKKKDTIIKKIKIKKKVKKQPVKYPLIIDKDTLTIENFNILKQKDFSVKCEGHLSGIEVFYLRKFKQNPAYLYCFGNAPKLTINKNDDRVKDLTIILIKSNSIVDTINIKSSAEKYYSLYLKKQQNFNLTNIDDILNFSYGQEFCGGDYGEYLFFRKNDKLIKGLSLDGYGEPGRDFYSQDLVLPKNNKKNQIWVENKYGDSKYDEYKNIGTLYIKYFDKYEIHNDSLVLLNPKKNKTYYITAKKGLYERISPNINSQKWSKLKFSQEVKVLNKTSIEHNVMDNGKLIKGNWIQIESPDKDYSYPTYVFGGYLSEMKPNE